MPLKLSLLLVDGLANFVFFLVSNGQIVLPDTNRAIFQRRLLLEASQAAAMELMSTLVNKDSLVLLGRVSDRLNTGIANRAPQNLFSVLVSTFLGLNDVSSRLKNKRLMLHKAYLQSF